MVAGSALVVGSGVGSGVVVVIVDGGVASDALVATGVAVVVGADSASDPQPLRSSPRTSHGAAAERVRRARAVIVVSLVGASGGDVVTGPTALQPR